MKVRELRARVLMAMACVNVIAALMIGCPKPPGPGPNRPDASDAAPAPPPTPPPPAPRPATCSEACANVNRLGGKGTQACSALCPKILDQAFKDCLARATSRAALDDCDKQEAPDDRR